jgi:hypothetical protein
MDINSTENVFNTGPSPQLNFPIIDLVSLFSMGDLVLVDAHTQGYITSITPINKGHETVISTNSIIQFNIKYIIGNNNVTISYYKRIRVINMNVALAPSDHKRMS